MAQTIFHSRYHSLIQPISNQHSYKDIRIFLQRYINTGTFSVPICLSQSCLITCVCLFLGWDDPHCFESKPPAGSEGTVEVKSTCPRAGGTEPASNSRHQMSRKPSDTADSCREGETEEIVLIIFILWDLKQFSSCRGFFLSFYNTRKSHSVRF